MESVLPSPLPLAPTEATRARILWDGDDAVVVHEPLDPGIAARPSARGVLALFIRLADLPPRSRELARAVKRIADRYGRLYQCRHGVIGGFHGDADASGEIDDAVNFHACPEVFANEYVAVWRYHADRLAAILRLGRALRASEMGSGEDWARVVEEGTRWGTALRPASVNDGWRSLGIVVQLLLLQSLALNQIHLTGTPEQITGWQVYAGIGRLPSLLAVELAFAVMRDEDGPRDMPLLCQRCGQPIQEGERQRRPRLGMTAAHVACNNRARWQRAKAKARPA
jgi:hypothetical protein